MSIVNKDFTGKGGDNSRRLPPGQTQVTSWPVLSYEPTPHIDTEEWSLTIDGEVNSPITINWETFNNLSQTQLKTDIHCVTRWSRFDMPWEGVSIEDLISLAGGLKPNANFLLAKSFGGYTTNLPIWDVLGSRAMIATHADGEPLTDEHGGPARLFVPHLYFWKSAKWISQLTFSKTDKSGFWEVNGYHNYGDPWKEERYSDEY